MCDVVLVLFFFVILPGRPREQGSPNWRPYHGPEDACCRFRGRTHRVMDFFIPSPLLLCIDDVRAICDIECPRLHCALMTMEGIRNVLTAIILHRFYVRQASTSKGNLRVNDIFEQHELHWISASHY